MTFSNSFRIASFALSLGIITGCASTSSVTPPAQMKVDAPKMDSGTLGNAPYRIDIPVNWNGELVMLLHGYEPKGFPRETPWPQNEAAPVFLAQGYAVAASAYSSQGWSVADAVPDNEQLRAHFNSTYGKPRHTYLVGFSLGGHIALSSLEKYKATYDGALSLCGVNVPAAKAFDESVLTSLVAFEFFFPGAMGLASGGLSDPASPIMLDPEALEASLKSNEAAAEILSKRLEVPRAGLAGALMLDNMVLHEMQARAGGFPVDNNAEVYSGFGDDAAFNKGVRRYSGDHSAMKYLAANAELSGNIFKPVILQSNNADPTVPTRFNAVYPALVKAAGHANNLVTLPSMGEGHCAFTPEEINGAFNKLTEWVNSGHRPKGV
ncbi:MAG: alpha/beta hydrolase [Arenimonas sp.]